MSNTRHMQKQAVLKQVPYCRSCNIEISEGEYCGPCDPANQRRGIFIKVHYTEVWSKSCRCGTHQGPHWMLSIWPFWEELLNPLACYRSHLQSFEALLREEVQRVEYCVLHNPGTYDHTRLVTLKQCVSDINWAKLTYNRLLLSAKYNVADHMACAHIVVETGTDILQFFSLLSPEWQQRVATYRIQREELYTTINQFIARINEMATRGNALLRTLLFATEQRPTQQSLW